MTFCFRSSSFASLILIASTAHAAEPFDAFLETHGPRCHRPEKGDLRIDQLSRDFKLGADTRHWAEMATFFDARTKEVRAAHLAARPAVSHFRLRRKEYENTVCDPAKPGELNEGRGRLVFCV